MGIFSLASWKRLPYRIAAKYSRKPYPRVNGLAFDTLIKNSNDLNTFYTDTVWWNHLEDYAMYICKINSMISGIVTKTMISKSAVIEENVTIKGPVIICDHAHIRSGSYIVGPVIIGNKSLIGPNCFLNRNLVIGPETKITQGAELKNSLLKRNVAMYHFSYIGDSLVGENVNIAAGVITAVQRFDKSNIKIHINNSTLDTSRQKYGTIIGDNVQLGVDVIIYPGRTIQPKSIIPPGMIVKRNITAAIV